MGVPPEQFDDADAVQWMEAIKRRDSSGLQALYARYSGPIFSLLVRMLDRAAAEEVLQDTFVRVWEKGHLFDGSRASPLSWMLTIARNFARDRLRRRQRRPETVPFSSGNSEHDEAGDDIDQLVWSVFPYSLLENWQGPVASLSEEQRRVILLYYFGGLTHTDIAKETGRPLGTVKSDLRRAMQRLQEWGKEHG